MSLQQSPSPPTIPGPSFPDEFRENQYTGEDGLYLLHSAIAVGASYDSFERYPPPRCHPQTRKVVFEIILGWLNNANHGPRILWVHSAPGSGKTAIAQTVSEYCAQSGQLGATFFFSHCKGDLSDGRLLFPTIVYKLASSIPEIRVPLSRAIQADTSILNQSLEVQIQKLIVEPYRTVPPPALPTLIVIDALDACSGDEMQCRILTLIARLIIVHRLPLCFFVTSRLEPHLQGLFDTPVFCKLSTCIPLDAFPSDTDVRIFLRTEFASIQHHHRCTMATINPDPWPSNDVLELLVQNSGGQFLYPATILKYVDDPCGMPAERLMDVVVAAASAPASMLAPIDQLYHHILSSSADSAALLRVLGPTAVLYAPLPPAQLALLLGAPEADVHVALRDTHALVDGPAAPGQGVRVSQASTMEFLLDIRRGLQFWVEAGKYHAALARGCIRYIAEYMDNADTLDLASYQYVRRKWTRHLAQATPSTELLDDLGEVRFVYSRVPEEVQAVVAWLQKIPNPQDHLLHLWRGWQAELCSARGCPLP
ncbi:hypothetical protein DFH07DRAFT_1067170 [Mycena maculata]|uniref:Nephrocystin 3-like N-terminal domain-containing protein n=1 Tax=Mycena maculata TaxID=230809 RepID=A0AAD7HMB2_9AGAR|nr:hypothetical protein DFH07DRAFT_1067170 [Mycena maculata]